jgi:hypothetical protein
VSFPGRDVEVAPDWGNPRVLSVAVVDVDNAVVCDGSVVVSLSGEDVVVAVWAKPVQSVLVTMTSAVRVIVVTVVLLFHPTPVKVTTDRLADVVSHEAGMVYCVVAAVDGAIVPSISQYSTTLVNW